MQGSRRSAPLPRDWARTRRRILRRDQRMCYVCHEPGANAVDHIVPAVDHGSEADSNLAAIHEHPCHARKTAREANAHNLMAVSRKREEEKHPGDISANMNP